MAEATVYVAKAKCTKMQFSIPFKCILSPIPYFPMWKTDYKPLGIDQPAYISDPNALMIPVVECSSYFLCYKAHYSFDKEILTFSRR